MKSTYRFRVTTARSPVQESSIKVDQGKRYKFVNRIGTRDSRYRLQVQVEQGAEPGTRSRFSSRAGYRSYVCKEVVNINRIFDSGKCPLSFDTIGE